MYEPQVNDYVEWTTQLGQLHEGWVYFKAEPTQPKRGWSHRRDTSRLKWVSKKDPITQKTIPIGIFIYFYVVMNRNGMS